MTDQEIYDTVLTHLRKQGCAAKSASDKCRYRGLGGTACAVGCLIPDDLYDPRIEGLSAPSIMAGRIPPYRASEALDMLPIAARIASHIGAEHTPLLAALQNVHDGVLAYHGLPVWEDSMRLVAGKFNLKDTPPVGVFEADQ